MAFQRSLILFVFWSLSILNNIESKKSPLAKFGRNSKRPLVSPDEAQNVIQIVESEIFDGKDWIGAKTRWTDMKGKESEPPSLLDSPERHEYEGDWKIVTSANRDSLGWEYLWALDQPAMRRRLWLRTIIAKPSTPQKGLARKLKDRWNFKGFGMSFYKSVLNLESIGLSIWMPLLANFDFWERRLALPSLSTSVSFYFPWMAIYVISSSMNVDFLAWVMGRTFRYFLWGFAALTLAAIRISFLPLALILYPLRRKLELPDFPLPLIPDTPPVYSLTIQQRIGMSISWRVSQQRGYEFRVSYWWMYVPTMMHLYEVLRRKHTADSNIANWLRRKVGSTGIAAGGPTPVEPHYWVAAMLSFSGFYFRKPSSGQKTVVEEKAPLAQTLFEKDAASERSSRPKPSKTAA